MRRRTNFQLDLGSAQGLLGNDKVDEVEAALTSELTPLENQLLPRSMPSNEENLSRWFSLINKV